MIKRLAAGVAVVVLVGAAQAQERSYPARPIRMIIPTTPGSPPDLVSRLIGEKLTAALGEPLVFDNRPGATGIVGLELVARAKPDGYTLGAIALPYLVNATIVPNLTVDLEKDLAPVALVDWSYNILAVPANSAYKSLGEVMEAAKAQPGKLRYSTGGNGTPGHLAGALLRLKTGVDVVHIPYKGSAASVLALIAGDVELTFGTVGTLSPHLKAGKARALATTAPHRIRAFPEVPTFAELGYPDVQISDWQGFVAPAGTPAAVIAFLSREVAKAVLHPDVNARLESFGMEPASAGPEQFALHIRSEMQRWRAVVRDAGIKAD